MAGEEGIGAVDEDAAYAQVECWRRQAQHAVAAVDHLSPHLVEEVR